MAHEEETTLKKKRSSSTLPSEDEPATKKKVDADSSSSDNVWDVEECRGDHESVEHWELRKEFLVQNMGRFTKSRLICLSQVFANMEFLGCRYPEETMELVHELSLGIVEEYREKQKTRLQRTFVKASDAAERKTKGTNSKRAVVDETGTRSTVKFVSASPSNFNQSSSNYYQNLHPEFQRIILLVYAYNVGESAVCIITRSCSAANVPIAAEFQEAPGGYTCTYRIGKSFAVTSTEHHSKDYAKNEAGKMAFKELQKHCYTFVTKVKVMPDSDGKEIGKEDVDKEKSDNVLSSASSAQSISSNNVGSKLLKLMGWTGGGLGKNEQGMHEAISVDGVVGRSRLGLGNTTGSAFTNKIKDLLEDHKRMGFPYDLKFSSDFAKDERKDIHMIAQRLGLKSKSFGKDEDRYIVVSEKVSRKHLLENTLAKGGETDKYCVIPPGGSLQKIEDYV